MELTQAGPWTFDRKLGAGGMGAVYLGTHKETGQVAAVKVLPASLAREEGFVERFMREIASMEKLKSPYIVEFVESGNDGDTYFYAMEFVDGETLTSRLKREKRLPWQEVIDLCLQICRALKAAHNAGIIHRDLKPSNLMIASDGSIKLTDFGVAQVFASQKLTITGGIVGTAEYMSPEQAKGQRATKKSDLYSLGAVMYVMLTGRPPFSGKTSLDVIHKHQFAQFDRPGLIATDCPKQLEEIVCKLLEKEPDKRFPDAYVLSLRLAEVQKRFAWQASQLAAPSSKPPAVLAEATEASDHARSTDDNEALPPTVLIPDAYGKNIPLGPTVAAVPMGDAEFRAIGSTMTASSVRPSDPSADQTRQIGSQSQGPGTLMRNLMRKVIAEQQAGNTFSRLFDDLWVQVVALLLLIAGGFWWFQTRELPQEERFAAAMNIVNQSPSTDWMIAKEYLESLRRQNPHRWEPEVSPHLQRIKVYEAKLKLRSTRHKAETPTSEPQRVLQLAQYYLDVGDVAQSLRMFDALITLTEGHEDFREIYDSARDFRQVLRDDRSERSSSNWLIPALKRADQLAADNKINEAKQIWTAIVALYANDPDASVQVERAKQNLNSQATTTEAGMPNPTERTSASKDSVVPTNPAPSSNAHPTPKGQDQ